MRKYSLLISMVLFSFNKIPKYHIRNESNQPTDSKQATISLITNDIQFFTNNLICRTQTSD